MNLFKTATLIVLFALPCAAGAETTPSDRAARFKAELSERFHAADANGDGQLSRDEAQAGMPRVYAHFDAIDSAHKGYLTEDDIVAAVRARVLARRGGAAAP